ncbi:hypothetical protein BN1723_015793 [Verticillium longisporum]|uniref:Uncharacterized protein n=1 Tax=Verticillium longisporum TaxID=100787 RepID=A0A0G4N2W6_VERLO|nr:hypothetical protein BN1723_015793 [Verticillium longisporum]
MIHHETKQNIPPARQPGRAPNSHHSAMTSSPQTPMSPQTSSAALVIRHAPGSSQGLPGTAPD